MEEEIYKLSSEEIEAINEGITQIENGQYISHEQANKEIKEFFAKWEQENKKE